MAQVDTADGAVTVPPVTQHSLAFGASTVLQAGRDLHNHYHDSVNARAEHDLASAVAVQWEHESAVRNLRRPAPLRVRWHSTDRPVEAAATAVLGEDVVAGRPIRLRFSGDVTDVAAAFLQLPRRQLVVLGVPGAGKSVLAMLLTLDLVRRHHQGQPVPVPVLFSVSSWNPRADHLHTWMRRRFQQDYPALAHSAASLIESGRILPVLDGLDELPGAEHAAALDALDRAAGGGRPFVLTCRTTEYQDAVRAGGRVLATAAVIELRPSTVPDTIRFLGASRPADDARWEPVFEHLRLHPTGYLAEAVSTPLVAWLARITYTDPATDPRELIGIPEVEDHLLRSFFAAVYSNQPSPTARSNRTGPNPDRARRWLAWLALHLHGHHTYDLAWWLLPSAMPRSARAMLIGLVLGLLGGFLGTVQAGLEVALERCLVGGLVGGAVGVAAGLWGKVLKRWQGDPQLRTRPHRLGATPSELITVYRRQLVLGVLVGVLGGLAGGEVPWLVFELLTGIAGGMLGGRASWFDYAAGIIGSPDPHAVFRGDRNSAIVQAFVAGTTGGVVGAFASGSVTGCLVGVGVGAVACLVMGTWGALCVARAWLAMRGKTPWRLMSFLEDAHARGVLRRAGALYQFRHARLQDQLVREEA